jgi:CheY-like chemotaxis protein
MAKILLVEDDTNLSEIYQARMEAEGYDVVAATDGETALAVAAKEKPDLIISDVMMPKISGFEMLDILRNTEELKHTPVIMLTALGQTDDKGRAERLGADRYLVKSQVTLEDIVNAAHAILQDGDTPAVSSDAAAPAADPPPAPATSEPAKPAEPAAPPAAADAPAKPADPAVVAMPVAAPPADNTDDSKAGDTPAPAATDASQTATPQTPVDEGVVDHAINELLNKSPQQPPADAGHGQVLPGTDGQAPAADGSDSDKAAKKVISPISKPPVASLDELLAREEAKDIAANPASPATPAQPAETASASPAEPAADAQPQPAADAKEDDKTPPANKPSVDPNSIAL